MYYEPSYYVYAAIVFVYYGVRFFGNKFPTILLSLVISILVVITWQYYIVFLYGPSDPIWVILGSVFIGKAMLFCFIAELLFKVTLGKGLQYQYTKKHIMLLPAMLLVVLFLWHMIQYI